MVEKEIWGLWGETFRKISVKLFNIQEDRSIVVLTVLKGKKKNLYICISSDFGNGRYHDLKDVNCKLFLFFNVLILKHRF